MYVLAHAAALVLGDALSYPNDVADLLFLQLHISIKHAIMELVLKREAVEVHLELKKLVLDGLVIVVGRILHKPPVVLRAGKGWGGSAEVCTLPLISLQPMHLRRVQRLDEGRTHWKCVNSGTDGLNVDCLGQSCSALRI